MTATTLLMKEIETMPEETVAQVFDFAMFLKSRHIYPARPYEITPKDACGIFKDLKGIMDTTIERDEEDRV